ncbi:MAG: DNA-directed RNA polymerase subunit alpha [Bacteroidales bacterium]|nr:DNA-directed RNA polymerase subunit alpha [Bacteroidales bacterium]
MSIIPFQKPDKVFMLEGEDHLATFEFAPLEPGFGATIGNALRRVLLNSIEGYAITHVRIDGVHHEFSTIKGVMEDVVNILLNLKQIRLKKRIEEFDTEKVNIVITDQESFKGEDIAKFTRGFEVLNPELEICHMTKDVRLSIQLTINKGRGYQSAEENKTLETDIDVIPIASVFTPIKNVKYYTENVRVEQKTDYEKLIIEIATDGSINPKDALKETAKILIHHFMLFSDEKISLNFDEAPENEKFDEEILKMRQLLKTKLIDLDLSVRALNCLKAADVKTLGDLVTYNRDDLLKFRNFGKKSLTEIDEMVSSYKLSYGMDVKKYKLEKE